MRAVEGCHPDLHGLMYSNVLLTGAPIMHCVCPDSQSSGCSRDINSLLGKMLRNIATP